jgi:hypothetical protein
MCPRLGPFKAAAVALACVVVCACATAQRIDAAGDVRALLIAIRDDDAAAFDARVDRPALERQLELRILSRTERPDQPDAVQALGAMFAAPVARLAVGALVRPEVFRAVAEYYGYGPNTPVPPQVAIAGDLRSLPDGRVCATRRRDGPCVLTFADQDGVWRLVSFDGDLSLLKMK